MSFEDHGTDWVSEMKGTPDSTFDVAHKADTSLEQWLARPVLVKTYAWQQNANSGQVGTDASDREFNPWQEFLTNPRVKEKIDYYNLLRCKMHVKFVINGNPFFYGRAMAAYTPLTAYDDFHDPSVTDNMGVTSVLDINTYSQRPKIFLDPSTSQGGELVLPYIFPGNAMRLTNADWIGMGTINMFTLAPLSHANGQTTGEVDIQVFVWATDVTLSVPTSHDAQMGELHDCHMASDEYAKDGAISRPLSVLAHVANGIAEVGIFKPYAMATSMVATALSNAAYTLGYSRPPVVEDIHPYVPRYMGNLANTNATDTIQKLTLDQKQETTIDTRVMGFDGTDELSIRSIAQRESIIDVVGWTHLENHGSLLWNTRVTPLMWVGSPNPGSSGSSLAACGFAALPFHKWRGTMKYRFQIIGSAYHKGRLRVTYDPVDFNTIGPDSTANLTYSTIVDLDKTRDFTVPVGWGSQYSMLKMPQLGPVTPYDDVTSLSGIDVFANGILRLEVMNELTAPGSVESNVRIAVSVSAGEDIEFFEPCSANIEELTIFDPQMGELMDVQMGDLSEQTTITQLENAPIQSEVLDTMAAKPAIDNTHLVYYGDPVCSFRQMLRRYNFYTKYGAADTSDSNNSPSLVRWVLSDFPNYYGKDPTGMFTDGTDKHNLCLTTLMNYLTPAYVARRGSIRWKYMLNQTRDYGGRLSVGRVVPRNEESVLRSYTKLTHPGGPADPWRVSELGSRVINNVQTHSGAAVTAASYNPVLEVELPWYNWWRFSPARNTEFYGMRSSSTLPPVNENMQFHEIIAGTITGVQDVGDIEAFVAAGEDFNLAGYIGMPKVWYYDSGTRPTITGFADNSFP